MLQQEKRKVPTSTDWYNLRSFLVVIDGKYNFSLAKEVSIFLKNLPINKKMYQVNSNHLDIISSLAVLEARSGAYLIGVYNGFVGQAPLNIIFLEDCAYRQVNNQWVKSNLTLDPSTWEVTPINPLSQLTTHLS